MREGAHAPHPFPLPDPAIKGHQLIAPQGGSSHGDHAVGKVAARIQQAEAEFNGGAIHYHRA
ncbi:MAG: hypothetical protein ACO3ZD_02945 [Cyanobium sp.]